MSNTWKQLTQFVSVSQSQCLNLVIKKAKEMGEHGVIIFDLDGTLFDVEFRTYKIVQEFPETGEYSELIKMIKQVHPGSYQYDLIDTFQPLIARMASPEKINMFFNELKNFWAQRFFFSSHLQFDQAAPGAVAYVKKFAEMGTRIFYLTGRDLPNMHEGTLASLEKYGFPKPEISSDLQDKHVPIQLFMKPSPFINDEIYKQEFMESMTHVTDKVIAQFENEPLNLGLFQKCLPEALHVFRDSHCSKREATPLNNIYKIKDFIYVPTTH